MAQTFKYQFHSLTVRRLNLQLRRLNFSESTFRRLHFSEPTFRHVKNIPTLTIISFIDRVIMRSDRLPYIITFPEGSWYHLSSWPTSKTAIDSALPRQENNGRTEEDDQVRNNERRQNFRKLANGNNNFLDTTLKTTHNTINNKSEQWRLHRKSSSRTVTGL